ncbi:MAG: hypothetical protein C4314_07420 [Thermoflexus sp.]
MTFENWFQSLHPAIPIPSALAVLRLTEESATVPFIARYRKEQTGGLDEGGRVLDLEDSPLVLQDIDGDKVLEDQAASGPVAVSALVGQAAEGDGLGVGLQADLVGEEPQFTGAHPQVVELEAAPLEAFEVVVAQARGLAEQVVEVLLVHDRSLRAAFSLMVASSGPPRLGRPTDPDRSLSRGSGAWRGKVPQSIRIPPTAAPRSSSSKPISSL